MYLVFDIGGTYIKYAIMDGEGNISFKNKADTPGGYDHTLDEFLEVMCKIYEECKDKAELEGMALSLPGQIDVENGIVYGGGALPYLDKINLSELLSEKCDGLPVALENDAKCAALAEVWIGNAKDCKSAVVLVFGTGIGGGIVVDGKVLHGVDLVAGEVSFWFDSITMEEVAHIKPFEELESRDEFFNYPRGLWHNKASIMGLRKIVASHKNLSYEEVTGEKIYEYVNEGDTYVSALLENTYLSIAKQLCNLYVILAPEIILIGGGISSRKEFFDGIMRYVDKLKKFAQVFRSMKVDTCKYLNDSNLIGALYNFLQQNGKCK